MPLKISKTVRWIGKGCVAIKRESNRGCQSWITCEIKLQWNSDCRSWGLPKMFELLVNTRMVLLEVSYEYSVNINLQQYLSVAGNLMIANHAKWGEVSGQMNKSWQHCSNLCAHFLQHICLVEYLGNWNTVVLSSRYLQHQQVGKGNLFR